MSSRFIAVRRPAGRGARPSAPRTPRPSRAHHPPAAPRRRLRRTHQARSCRPFRPRAGSPCVRHRPRADARRLVHLEAQTVTGRVEERLTESVAPRAPRAPPRSTSDAGACPARTAAIAAPLCVPHGVEQSPGLRPRPAQPPPSGSSRRSIRLTPRRSPARPGRRLREPPIGRPRMGMRAVRARRHDRSRTPAARIRRARARRRCRARPRAPVRPGAPSRPSRRARRRSTRRRLAAANRDLGASLIRRIDSTTSEVGHHSTSLPGGDCARQVIVSRATVTWSASNATRRGWMRASRLTNVSSYRFSTRSTSTPATPPARICSRDERLVSARRWDEDRAMPAWRRAAPANPAGTR